MKLLLLCLLLNTAKPSTDTSVTKTDYFIAMQYKGLSNCIYKVYITDSLIMCAKVNGYISVQPNFGIGTSIPTKLMHNPQAYVDKDMEAPYQNLLTDIPAFLNANRQNFIIRKKDIKIIFNNPESKFGMGYYPYGGRIIIQTVRLVYNREYEREFILVGDQNPDQIISRLKK